MNDIRFYGYNYQADFYTFGAEALFNKPYDFYFVFVETCEPFCVRIVKLSNNSMNEARNNNDYWIQEYREWVDGGCILTESEILVY
jgi:hypothetical protein